MGHRALVAYEQTDNTYSLHYSHWGGLDLQCKHRIAAKTPFGSAAADATRQPSIVDAGGEVQGRAAPDRFPEPTYSPTMLVDPTPIASGLTRDQIVNNHLDYRHHDAYFEVSPTFEVTAYRTLWFGLEFVADTIDDSETVGHGAIVTVQWHDGEPIDDAYLRGQFWALKDVAGDLLVDGGLAPADTIRYLLEKLRQWIGHDQRLHVSESVRLHSKQNT